MLRCMRFSAWLAKQPYGTAARIQRESGVCRRTIDNLAAEVYPTASFKTASLISPLTEGAVSIEDMCTPPKRAPKRQRRSA